VLAATVLGLGAWSSSLGATLLDSALRRSPLGLALPRSDAGTELSASVPLWSWSPAGWRVDGVPATPLPQQERASSHSQSTPCTAADLAAPATLRVAELRLLREHLLQVGVCELGLVVERLRGADHATEPLSWHGLPPTLRQELQLLCALHFERWGTLVLRLDSPPARVTGPRSDIANSSAELTERALVLVDSDGLRRQVPLSPDAALDARTAQAHWDAARDRQALAGELLLRASDDVTLATLVSVLAATRVHQASEAGADPFGHDAGARERALFEAVHWIP
jgi:hypothetical protein